MNTRAVLLAVAAAACFGAGWYFNGLRWQADWDAQAEALAQKHANKMDELNAQLTQSRSDAEDLRETNKKELGDALSKISSLERELAEPKPTKRLLVYAKCPDVPTAGANAGGVTRGTAELDATSRADYLAFRRAYEQQFSDLKLCRSELLRRSGKPPVRPP